METIEKRELNPGTILGPLPVALVSLGTTEKSNIITIAWTGIVCSKPAMTYISVRPERYSYAMLRERGEFVINLCGADLLRRIDLCGMQSGSKGDKFKICGFTKGTAAKLDDCPIIEEAPINIQCKVKQELELGSHTMFLAEIVGISVNAELVDKKGKLDLRKANIVGYMHGEYLGMGKHLANFGFSVKPTKTEQKEEPTQAKATKKRTFENREKTYSKPYAKNGKKSYEKKPYTKKPYTKKEKQ